MNFLNGSFKVGRLFEINIRVHILFLFWIAFRLFDASRQGFHWQFELLFLSLLFGIVLIHELGHCFGARAVGGDAHDIMMWPLGGLAYAHAPMRPWPQFVTVAAGPLVNVVFCLISGGIVLGYTGLLELILLNPFGGIYLTTGYSWIECLWIFYQVNLLLLAFNLLPIYPLDGGQLFHAIIWPFVGLQRASIIACQVGLVGCGLLAMWALSGQRGNMLLFIAIFGGLTCWQRYRAARHGLLVEDPNYMTYDPRRSQGRSFWSRIFKTKPRSRRPRRPVEFPNPNPGGWEARQGEENKTEADLDRILKKVHEQGINSLSYVERQKLERITRQRQKSEREFQRDNRV
ncbi:MAG: site-2 protease family protein [Phycisphaerae bacterium]|nr:site-2 protease family protein [Phycisphaerae bacterium]